MEDTTTEFKELVRSRIAALEPHERVRMCLEMFDTAQALVEASLPPELDPVERRKLICRRFYGALADRAYPSRR
jgi:hypothetical protein